MFKAKFENEYSNIYEQLKNEHYIVIEQHDIDIDLIDKTISDWRAFFADDKKFIYARTDKMDEGYITFNVEHCNKDQAADYKELYQTHYSLNFPDILDSGNTSRLFTQMVTLCQEICTAIKPHLPSDIKSNMTVDFDTVISDSKNHLIRIIKYPQINEILNVERAAAHTDICLLTSVFGAQINGLEIQTKAGQWVCPPVKETDIIFFTSEMLALLTHGDIKAASHRVVTLPHAKENTRWSIPIGYHPLRQIKLNSNITAVEYLKHRLNEMGYNGDELNFFNF
ncbi:MAG: hypothetical protein O2809_02630 [Proteobacteria bacterium]|nr:hypothetical protein [Pseudomonadota bacterium]